MKDAIPLALFMFDVIIGVAVEAGLSWQVSLERAVGVLDLAALPRAAGIAE
jgi:hypothetical protein